MVAGCGAPVPRRFFRGQGAWPRAHEPPERRRRTVPPWRPPREPSPAQLRLGRSVTRPARQTKPKPRVTWRRLASCKWRYSQHHPRRLKRTWLGVRSPVAPLTLDNWDNLSLAPPRLVARSARLLASAPLGDRGDWDGHGGSDSRRSPHTPHRGRGARVTRVVRLQGPGLGSRSLICRRLWPGRWGSWPTG